MKPHAFLPALLGFVLATAPVAAASVAVPFDIQVPLLLKALTYDRNLKSRAGEQVRIAVLVPSKGGRGAAEDLQTAVGALPDRTVNGLPVSFREISVNDEATLDRALGEGRWAAAYVLPGFGREELEQIKRVCQSRHVLAVAASVEEVERGLAFAVGVREGKPQIVVNLPGSKACGSEFDLALLRVSRVIQ